MPTDVRRSYVTKLPAPPTGYIVERIKREASIFHNIDDDVATLILAREEDTSQAYPFCIFIGVMYILVR